MKNSYSLLTKFIWFGGYFGLSLCVKNSRFIRFPFDIRGRKFIYLGVNLTTGVGCRFEAFSKDNKVTLFFGNNVQVNDYVHICAMKKVVIGNNVLMASHIYISDSSHGFYRGNTEDTSPDIPPIERPYRVDPVKIEDNVWIGESVTMMPGVIVGRDSIIGSNSVVTKNTPPYTISVGSPAKVVKQYNFETKCWERV